MMGTGPRSSFVKVRCAKCKNEQIIFGNVSSMVKCLVCDTKLAAPTGGKSNVSGHILEVLS